jgi:hypothetical protein
MGARKNLTIGVTVNLEHYENLRLEVNDDVGSATEVDDLIRFLDEILGKFGREDPGTAERVDNYRKRVLPKSRPGAASMREDRKVTGILPVEVSSEPAAPGSTAEGTLMPDVIAVTPSVEDRPPESGPCCEICGGNVTAAEQKMSQLFTGKTLCRACMKKV